MVKIHCHTNLDLIKTAEKWPEELPEVPRVGDYIQSNYKWLDHYVLELVVVRVT